MGEDPSFDIQKSAQDELYLQNLKQKIQDDVGKRMKEINKKDKQNINKTSMQEKGALRNSQDNDKDKENEFKLLKLKEKERKKRKQEEKFNTKVNESQDKLKEMSIKALKMEKITILSEEEIQKMKEKAQRMVEKSIAKEKDFENIFLN